MKHTYHIASPAAIIGGIAAALGAIALLVRDAFVSGWTVDLGLMPVLVGLTILAGHLFWESARSGRLISAAGLALVATLGSAFVVYETTGRRAEIRDVKVAAVTDTEKNRQHLRQMLSEAEVILAKHRAAAASECATGRGKRCDGATYTVQTWESAVTGYEAKLSMLPPPKPTDPKAERFSAVVALFTSAKADDVKKAVAIFEPFALPLILELGSIVFFSYGVSFRRKIEIVPPIEPPRPPPRLAGRRASRIDAERDLITLIAFGRKVPSQDWLASRWHVRKSTVSKWMAQFDERGIINRVQSGRHKQIEAA